MITKKTCLTLVWMTAAALALPAYGADTLKAQSDNNEAGLLLPAVQKVRDAGTRPQTKPQTPTDVKPGQSGEPRGLLLPAIQKAHDTGAEPAAKPQSPMPIKPGENADPRGLLLPAVQKAK